MVECIPATDLQYWTGISIRATGHNIIDMRTLVVESSLQNSDKQRTGPIFPTPLVLAVGIASAIYTSVGHILAGAYTKPPAEAVDRQALFVAISLCVIVAQTFILAHRERHPVSSFLAMAATMGVVMLLLNSRTFAHTPLYIFSVISLSIHVKGRRFATPLTAAILLDIVCQLALMTESEPSSRENLTLETANIIINVIFTYIIYVSIGKIASNYRSKIFQFHRRFSTLQDEHRRHTKEIIVHERRQMARELHDITAHHLTGIVIQSEVASKLYEKKPAEVRDLLTSISSEAKNSLESLRQIVGILRLDGGFDIAPQPTMDNIHELIDDFRKRIESIELEEKGNFDHLSTAIQLTCYRIVEESLSNVVKHAPNASVTISLASSGGAIAFDIVNSPPQATVEGSGGGFGLVGMAERVDLLGGTLRTGPTAEGGWQVCGRICGKEQDQ